MVRASVLLALLLAAVAGAGSRGHQVKNQQQWPPHAVFKYGLVRTEDLPACSADTSCVLDVYATSTAVVAVDGDGSSVTVQNSAANGFEAAPMVSGSGATVYAAKDITDATAPYISAADAQSILGTTFYSGDMTILCAVLNANATAGTIVGHGVSSTAGFDAIWNGTTPRARWSQGGVGNIAPAYGTSGHTSKWGVWGAFKSGTTFGVRWAGTEVTSTSALVPDNPSAYNLYFGRYNTAGFALGTGSKLHRCRFWNTALSSTTKALREAQMLKGLAVRPADTYVTTTRASAASDHYGGYVAFSGDNVRIPSPNGIRSESAGTNLVFYSADFDNAAWTKSNSVVTANDTAGVFRTTTAEKLANDTSNTVHRVFKSVASLTVGATYTESVYAKAGTLSWIGVHTLGSNSYATFNLSTGAIGATVGGSSTITAMADGWYRVTMTFVATATTEFVDLHLGRTSDEAATTAYVGAGEYLYIEGAQFETGGTATSYVATGAASATRAADVHVVSSAGWPTTSGEVSLVYTPNSATAPSVANGLVDSRSGAGTNGVLLYRETNNAVYFITYGATQTCSAASAAQTWPAGTDTTLEGRWTATTCEVLKDGVSVATGVASGTPASHDSTANIGSSYLGASQANGWIRSLCVARPGGCN